MNRKLHFTIADAPVNWRTHRIMELCEFLSSKVLEPLLLQQGTKWDRRFMDFFTFDNSCDPLDPTGTIQLAIPPVFSGRIRDLECAVLRELSALRIKTGPFTYQRDPRLGNIRGISIPILENPTALMAPPEVNMSQTRGYLVLRDLLGYRNVNGRYEFSPEDLVKRLASITDDKIAACTASPVKSSEGLRRIPSAISIKAIRRCLDEVRQFALWAVQNRYPKVAAV